MYEWMHAFHGRLYFRQDLMLHYLNQDILRYRWNPSVYTQLDFITGFLYYLPVCCNWNDWYPAGFSNNNMHMKTALCLLLFTACILLCELPDIFAQSHLSLSLHSTFVCLLFFFRYTIASLFLLELSLVMIPALTSWLHNLFKMNFKLEFWLLSFLNVGVGQKEHFQRLYLYKKGNATAYAAGADMQPKEMASNISILPYFPLSSSENVTFHCAWHSFI